MKYRVNSKSWKLGRSIRNSPLVSQALNTLRARDTMSTTEMSKELGRSVPNTMKVLNKLVGVGLAETYKKGRKRFYKLKKSAVDDLFHAYAPLKFLSARYFEDKIAKYISSEFPDIQREVKSRDKKGLLLNRVFDFLIDFGRKKIVIEVVQGETIHFKSKITDLITQTYFNDFDALIVLAITFRNKSSYYHLRSKIDRIDLYEDIKKMAEKGFLFDLIQIEIEDETKIESPAFKDYLLYDLKNTLKRFAMEEKSMKK